MSLLHCKKSCLLSALLLWMMLAMPLLSGFIYNQPSQGQLIHTLLDVADHRLATDHVHEDGSQEEQRPSHQHGGDSHHDLGKLLPYFVLAHVFLMTSWSSIYHFYLPPEPASSFERPPKTSLI